MQIFGLPLSWVQVRMIYNIVTHSKKKFLYLFFPLEDRGGGGWSDLLKYISMTKTSKNNIDILSLCLSGAYSGGGAVSWIFRILRERALSLNTAIVKGQRGRRKNKKYIVSGLHPSSSLLAILIFPFSPIFTIHYS